VDISGPYLQLLPLFLPTTIRDQVKPLQIHKSPKFWRNTLLTLPKSKSKKLPSKHCVNQRAASSMILLPTIAKILVGKDKKITKLIPVVEEAAARIATATRKTSWKEPKKRQQRKSNKSKERREWKSSRRRAEGRICSGLVSQDTVSIFDSSSYFLNKGWKIYNSSKVANNSGIKMRDGASHSSSCWPDLIPLLIVLTPIDISSEHLPAVLFRKNCQFTFSWENLATILYPRCLSNF